MADVTYREALETLRRAIEARAALVVTTPNPEFVMLARRDRAAGPWKFLRPAGGYLAESVHDEQDGKRN